MLPAFAPDAAASYVRRHDDPAARAQAERLLLDDPAEWPSFGRPLDGGDAAAARWESQVVVEDMRCAACARIVESALAAVPGVERAEVNGASHRARIVWSAAALRPSRWFEAVAAAGYRLVPAGDLQERGRRLRESRLALWRWLVAGLCMMQVMMYAYPAYTAQPGDLAEDSAQLLRWASWVLTLPVLLFSCAPFFRSACADLRRRRVGMDLPVALGIAITFAVSSAATFDPKGLLGHEVYFDSLTMFVFFLLTGRWLEARLRDRTAGALETLMNRLPDSVERLGADGRFERVAARRVVVGDVLLVLPGEAFPADGVVIEGDTSVDEAMLSGESRPLARTQGQRVLAGSHNLSAPVQVRVERVGQGTRFAQIVALMEGAALDKPRFARLADRMAGPFLLAVLSAGLLAGAFWWPVDHGKALMVVAAVLIVTCPCALSLATPAAMLASAGALARRGFMVRRLQALERLASIDTVVFDKTGTLTRGEPRLSRIYCRPDLRPRDALERAALVAGASLHPVARALVSAWRELPDPHCRWRLLEASERGGSGIDALVVHERNAASAASHLRLGSAAFCGVPPLAVDSAQVHLCDEAGWLASFVLVEDPRADAADAVARLKAQGLQVQLLSGDHAGAAQALAARVGIAQVRAECSPEDKLRHVQALQAAGHRVLMVGDGMNDGPVLARADASLAVGAAVPLAQARADFVALGGELMVVPQAMVQARSTLRVVRQNLAWAAAYNLACIPLAVAGWLPAWLAGLGMAASSLLVVLNAARLAGGGRQVAR